LVPARGQAVDERSRSEAGRRMTRVAYLDASAGIAGDMILGALVDAGLPLAVLEDLVDRLGFEDVELKIQHVTRGAIAATKLDVCRGGRPIAGSDDVHLVPPPGSDGGAAREHLDDRTDHDHDHGHSPEHEHPEHEHHEHAHHGRTLAEVLAILARAGDLSQGPLAQAAEAFRRLADAEARVHGMTPASVHFHEVGATDALVDIAGVCLGLQHLGVEALYVSPLPWGSGTVETQHGTMPIPAPATALLLEGLPTVPSAETYEQVTPTGAALVRALADGHRTPAGFVPERTGFGAGTYDGSRMPNIVRLTLGSVAHEVASDHAMLLETNLDDASGQVIAFAVQRALDEGALDAWFTPITMKKGRPGVLLSLLVRPEEAARFEDLLFVETPTLGVRRRHVERAVLSRHHEEVATAWGTVRMKVRTTPGGAAATPEYEDCAALASRHGVAVQTVMTAAQAAWTASSAS
jgi:uncharacterized protein (TIGR00299 family) protein